MSVILFNKFLRVFGILFFIKIEKIIPDHYQRFMSLGWTECRIQTIDQIVRQFFSSSEKDRIRRFVDDPFDEIEELQLKCSHYILIVGTKFANRKLSLPYEISSTEESKFSLK